MFLSCFCSHRIDSKIPVTADVNFPFLGFAALVCGIFVQSYSEKQFSLKSSRIDVSPTTKVALQK